MAVCKEACAPAEVPWAGEITDLAEFEVRLTRHLPRLDALGVEYRPLDGPHPWQAAGTGVWRRSGPGRIEETKKWVESVSREARAAAVESPPATD